MKRKERQRAIRLRYSGYSLGEIAEILGISKSTASLWLCNLYLGKNARAKLADKSLKGRQKGIETNRNKKQLMIALQHKKARQILSQVRKNKNLDSLLCAILYWCEGEKSDSVLRFANSDPVLVATFLSVLRSGFDIDETKLRVCLHLHEYHNVLQQKKFWSTITRIPKEQFLKIYLKPHTGKRKKKEYPGCASIRYHDYRVARALKAIWEQFGTQYGRVG